MISSENNDDFYCLNFLHLFRTRVKTPSIIYADLESLIKRTDRAKNNFEKLSTTKLDEDARSRYSISSRWEFDGAENNHDVYRRKDCIKTFLNP